MRAFIAFILIIIFGFLAAMWLPWWSIAIVSFLVSLLLYLKPFAAFLTAFLAGWIFWAGYAFFTDLQNDHILSTRMALLIFNTASPTLMIVVGALPAALTAGTSALCASFLRTRKKTRSKSPSFRSYYQS